MKHKLTYRVILLTVLAVLFACSKKPSDDVIANHIESKLASNSQTQQTPVAVECKDGKVTLTGTVKDDATRDTIERLVKEEPGVSSVANQITVEPAQAATLPPPTNEVPAPAQSGPKTRARASEPVTEKPAPELQPVLVPEGTALTIRTDQPLGSKTSQVGTAFTGTIVTPITINGKVAVPGGSAVTGVVKEAKKAGRMKGAATLSLTLDSVTVNGHTYNIETGDFSQTSTGKGKRTAGIIAGGTGVGAAIGGIAGGGKGAAIGALTGAAAGTIGAGTTGKRDIELPVESALTFKLSKSLTLKPASAPQ